MKYNYLEAIKEDVKNAINENYEGALQDLKNGDLSRENFEEQLHDDLWTDDSVTGNASGSYTFNSYQAEENLSHNLDLLEEVASEFGIEPTIKSGWEHGAEWWDVTIRCYYLSNAISEVLDEMGVE